MPHGHGSHGGAVPEEFLAEVGLFALFGACYSVAGWLNTRAKQDSPEPFRPRKAIQTVLIGAGAGAVVAWQGRELTGANLEAAMAVAIPIINQLVNWQRIERQRDRTRRAP